MANTTNKRMLEINVWNRSSTLYRLYVKEGKPIRIQYYNSFSDDTIYPNDNNFDWVFQSIVFCLFEKEEVKLLKELYDVLDERNLKARVKRYIDKLIENYEKRLAILKS